VSLNFALLFIRPQSKHQIKGIAAPLPQFRLVFHLTPQVFKVDEGKGQVQGHVAMMHLLTKLSQWRGRGGKATRFDIANERTPVATLRILQILSEYISDAPFHIRQ